MPAWLLDAVDQARAAATDHQLPVAVLHEVGRRYDKALVVMTMADFQAWFADDVDGGSTNGHVA